MHTDGSPVSDLWNGGGRLRAAETLAFGKLTPKIAHRDGSGPASDPSRLLPKPGNVLPPAIAPLASWNSMGFAQPPGLSCGDLMRQSITAPVTRHDPTRPASSRSAGVWSRRCA